MTKPPIWGRSRTLRLFPTPVIIEQLPEAAELNAALEPAIMTQMKADGGVVRSNVGGWHSSVGQLAWAGDAGKRLIDRAIAIANAHTADDQDRAANVQWRVDAWANVSGSGHSNAMHTHGGAYWSVVYYVRAGGGEGGRLQLHDPRMPGLAMHAPALRLKDSGPEIVASLKPRNGQMVLFPSWLAHSVEPWQGEGSRISIAINLSAAAVASRPVLNTSPKISIKDKP